MSKEQKSNNKKKEKRPSPHPAICKDNTSRTAPVRPLGPDNKSTRTTNISAHIALKPTIIPLMSASLIPASPPASAWKLPRDTEYITCPSRVKDRRGDRVSNKPSGTNSRRNSSGFDRPGWRPHASIGPRMFTAKQTVPENRELNLRNIKYCAGYETSIDGIVIDMKAIVGSSKRHEWKTIKPATMDQGS